MKLTSYTGTFVKDGGVKVIGDPWFLKGKMRPCLLYSGGYESSFLAARFPELERVFFSYKGTPREMEVEMRCREAQVVKLPFIKNGFILDAVKWAVGRYDAIMIGTCATDISERRGRFLDHITQSAEYRLDCFDDGVVIVEPLLTWTHEEVVKTMLSMGVNRLDIMPCEFWTRKKKRCGKCSGCVTEKRVLCESSRPS